MAKEYIKRDAVTRALASFRKGFQFEEAKCVVDGCILEVKAVPPEDVVEVVRCKDCKHWKHFDHLGCTDFVKVCGLANYMIGENGYCLYGEQRDNNA